MKKKGHLIVANWKMNPATLSEARLLFGAARRETARLERVEAAVCPPFPYLAALRHTGRGRFFLGAQDVFWRNGGRFTGQVSPEMLRDLGVSHCIVGHSERRAQGEGDDTVAKKAEAALKEGLKAIVCVGEKSRDADGSFFAVLERQLLLSLEGIPRRHFLDLIIAYEPLWAIGKSAREAMSARDVRETEIFLRKALTDAFGAEAARLPRILYGGAVEEGNIAEILSEGGVQGLLVGHASLDALRFAKMLKAADEV